MGEETGPGRRAKGELARAPSTSLHRGAASPRLFIALLCVAEIAVAGPATAQSAKEETRACVTDHVSAQRLRRDHHLRDAKAALVSCARPACPTVIVEECGAWLKEVEAALPSVVFEARGPQGEDLADVAVTLDGAALTSRLEGKAIEIDAGEHVFHYEHAGWPSVDQKLTIREGDKARRIQVQLTPGGAATTPALSLTRRPVPALAYGLAALGVVGLGTFAAFGAIGLSQKSRLDELGCKPSCDASAARRSFLIGDIALGVGVAAIGVGLAVYLARPTVTEPGSVRVAAALRPGGAWAVLEAKSW